MPYRILLRRDNSATWLYNDPVLMTGEPGYETDTGKLKIGDGNTPWSSLDYYTSLTGATGASGANGATGATGGSGTSGTSGTSGVDGNFYGSSGSSGSSGINGSSGTS
jgi:hyaluronoglucosaminidase